MALLPLAAMGVHQLRYEFAFGGHADHELAAQGHAYLTSLTPIFVLAATLVAAGLLARLADAWRGERSIARAPSVVALAASAAAILALIYVGQELLEGLCTTGHPAGLVGVFGNGGWWALPLAIVFGTGIALLLRCADAAIALIARVRSGVRPRPARRWRQPAPRTAFLAARFPFASAAPVRGPPLRIAPR